MIEIKNVTKKYGDYVAVEDISFKVEESSIYGLVGYNGAGKTTLLKRRQEYLSRKAARCFLTRKMFMITAKCVPLFFMCPMKFTL